MLTQRLPINVACMATKRPTCILQRANLSTSFQRQCLSTLRSNSTPFAFRNKVQQALRTQLRQDSTVAAGSPVNLGAAASETLTWNRFLKLRKIRRRMNLVASIVCMITALGGGITYISQHPELEAKISPLIGLDPLITMGIMTIASGGIGWLMGPTIGGRIFKLRYRSMSRMIAEKEKEFFTRIKKYRVNPEVSSLNNPVPDYYGEKIGSVMDYRKWLKDQRAFNLKREKL